MELHAIMYHAIMPDYACGGVANRSGATRVHSQRRASENKFHIRICFRTGRSRVASLPPCFRCSPIVLACPCAGSWCLRCCAACNGKRMASRLDSMLVLSALCKLCLVLRFNACCLWSVALIAWRRLSRQETKERNIEVLDTC